VVGAAALLLAALVWWGATGAVGSPLSALTGGSGAVGVEGWPSPVASGGAPLGTPAPVPAGAGSHRFSMVQDDGVSPVAYDPCRPIAVVVNGRTAPAGSGRLVDEALAEITRATGLVFVVEGSTDEAPTQEREGSQPGRYGDRWAPVLVAWSDPGEHPPLGGGVTGTGGSTAVLTDDVGWVYVSGSVVLDGPQLQRIGQGAGGYARARSVIVHELAHVVGLDHVEVPDHLMHPSATATTSLHVGDLTGLAAVGRGRCPAAL
jgi:hypothetical protein